MVPKNGDRRAEVGGRVVPEFSHAGMPLERGLDDSALDTSTAAVNQPHLAQACRCRRGDVLLDHRSNASCNLVSIESGLKSPTTTMNEALGWKLDR